VQYAAPRASDSGDQKDWLHTDRFTEVGDSRIQAQALALRASTPLQTARNIYEWVANSIAYAGFIADDLGALYALTERKGDCTEYAFLVVALARANQIPARMVGGYFADRDLAPRADEYHNWAELYVEGAWRLVDAQKRNWLLPCADYTAFRLFCGNAINAVGLAHRFAVDGDMQVRM
jgi:transglutaminase-like putative cysteine protease